MEDLEREKIGWCPFCMQLLVNVDRQLGTKSFISPTPSPHYLPSFFLKLDLVIPPSEKNKPFRKTERWRECIKPDPATGQKCRMCRDWGGWGAFFFKLNHTESFKPGTELKQ